MDLRGTFVADRVESDEHRLVPGTTVRVTFEKARVGLTAGCNGMSGPASLRDGRLVLDHLASTEMGCAPELMEQDAWLGAFLTSSPRLTVDEGVVTLAGRDVTMVLVPEAAPADAPLDGTTWRLETVYRGSGPEGSASSVPVAADDPMLRFRNGVAGWDAVFSTGCNGGSATVRIRSDVMDFDEPVTTLRACADDVAELERIFLGVLGRGTTYQLDGDRLTLTSRDGSAGLGFRAATGRR